MIKLRSYLFNFMFLAWTGFMCTAGLWIILLPHKALVYMIHFWAKGLAWLERNIVGINYKVVGKRNIPHGACIIASKHQSAWETCKLFLLLGDPAVVLKEELTRLPILKWYSDASGMIPIDRGGRVRTLSRMMKAAREASAAGRKIVIFPQGTRVSPGDKKPYKTGVAALYKELNIPIVPMALNSGLCWPKNTSLKKSGTITVEFLPPIPPGLERGEVMKRLQDQLETASDRLAGIS
ncbi:MAG: lysophospholipid acyltransferase family protein [Alphaproteobacteria bacterium]|nr:lysophospholipid acyltransferase family protein [Alphaproteobacteria bacterium]